MIVTGQGTATDAAADFNTDPGPRAGGFGSLLIKNTGDTNTIYVGATDAVDDTTGFPIPPGAAWSADFIGVNDVFVVCGSGLDSTYAYIYERNA